MLYKATKKFKGLSRINHHHGLERQDFDALMDGRVVDLKIVPSALSEGGYIEEFKKPKKKESK